ncbi:MAG: QueT transporter family protein [Limnochordia bacterium]
MQRLARAALIAAMYVVLVYVFQFASFGPLQFRVAEALTLLPILYPEAIGGVFVGVLVANLLGPHGPWDIFGGSLVSLLAALITYKYRSSWIAYASPIICNAFLISLYLRFIFDIPSYWYLVLTIGISEASVILLVGRPLIKFLQQRQGDWL